MNDTDELTINWPALVAIEAAILALFAAILALGKTLADDGTSSSVSVVSREQGGTVSAAVSLSEFAIDPGPVSLAAGGTIEVSNTGAAVHNLAVKETGLTTSDLGAGGSATLDTSDLAAGTYTLVCTVAGHEAAGMATSLVIGGSGDGPGADQAHEPMDPAAHQAAMVEAMQSSIEAFPAETEGVGAAVLEPTILPDGTKLFELTVDEIRWEVEPGKVVDAVGYNGMVPGPTMFADIDDKVTIRVINQLDHEGTSLHPHGLKDHEFVLDGVTFVSQDPIEPGDAMDYTFVATGESVMTYHSHHMSLHQVPNGLFGAMIIGDYATLAGVDDVADEVVMILNDAGNIGFSLNGKSFPATAPYVYRSGDKVVVHYANEGQMAHPMHLHNQTGTVIAKDGYLLPEGARYQGDTFNVAPGERLTVVYEMNQPGTWVWHCHILSHVKKTDGTMFGMLTAVIVGP